MTPLDLPRLGARWKGRPERAKPVAITAELMAPIACDEALPLMLDGALQHAVIVLATGDEPSDLFAGFTGSVEIPIPLVEERVTVGGKSFLVPRCSQAFFAAPPIPAVRVVKRTSDVESLGLGAVNISYGEHKSHLLPMASIIAPWVTWYALADVERLEEVLPHVLAIGRSRSHMMGGVARWAIDELDEDWSWEYRGNPMRPLPATSGPKMGFRAPYWLPTNATTCRIHNPRAARPPFDGREIAPAALMEF